MSVRRSLVAFVLACALALPACDSEPAVVVGVARSNSAGSAAGHAAAGASGNEEHEHDGDSADDKCSEDEPVCGEDGMTYQNACQADLAGVRIAKHEAC